MAAKQHPREFQFDLSGGHLTLDFANTVSRRHSPEKSTEHLTSYHDLISFARQTKLLTVHEAEAFRREAETNQRGAAQALRRALTLREAFFRTFIAVSCGKSGSPEDLQLMEKSALDALQHRRIARVNGGYGWQWDAGPILDKILWPVALSATDLLVSDDALKVRECEAPDCLWLFLDTSRNHSRRWCDMSSCGNRAKARRHYERQHASV